MSRPKKFIKIELYVEADSVYEAEENIRRFLIEEGRFEEGTDFIVEDSGECNEWGGHSD